MSAPTTITPPAEETPADPATFIPVNLKHYSAPQSQRTAGWTAERQRTFLQAIAEGATVTDAARSVGLTKQSAYAFRTSARGAGFALGWQAAALLARDTLAETLMERVIEGTVEVVTRSNGDTTVTIERERFDNRLAMQLLNRLDRMADSATGAAGQAAARLVAAEFDQYLDLVGRDGGPARAGLFLGARLGAAGAESATEDDLAPIRALARADRWLRTHTDLAEGVDTADLDPAARAGWTGEQWARAEAAGLVQLAPTPPPAPDAAPAPSKAANLDDEMSQLRQHFGLPPYVAPEDRPEPVWCDEGEEEWRTRFPPTDRFYGEEDGEYGQQGYSRTLDDDELAAVEASWQAEVELRRVPEARERDAWFAACVSASARGGEAAGDALDEAPDDADEDAPAAAAPGPSVAIPAPEAHIEAATVAN
ncbi:hypothetical protein LZK98_16340 [Sphingomonas cannabina]|uniref:hypothetical protein n=1 Tax=Sphingomonas cannabina TaxID=2899123 RepID=UPI001F221181|nr:hypothetical protein [Sphingomonas cannabina]UIJ44613.1 hypothetical protein LZK98_16340 [Sphingomonas cannabina]